MPNENTFVERLKNYILQWAPEAHFYRPNDARTSGVPDLFVFARSCVMVIEAKCPSGLPRNPEAPWLQHDFSPLQVAFLRKVWQNGTAAVGMIFVISTGECWLIPGDKISVRMSHDYVKQTGKQVSTDSNNPELWLKLIQAVRHKAERE